jgi:hypothetical protein
MEYIYETYKGAPDSQVAPTRIDTSARFVDVEKYYAGLPGIFTNVFKGNSPHGCPPIKTLITQEDYDSWRVGLERASAWKPAAERQVQGEAEVLPRKGVSYEVEDDGFHERVQNPVGQDKDPVNPLHYKNYYEGLQWIEAMERIARFRDRPYDFCAGLELQVRKYLDRGDKGSRLEDLQKAHWYLDYLIGFMERNSL